MIQNDGVPAHGNNDPGEGLNESSKGTTKDQRPPDKNETSNDHHKSNRRKKPIVIRFWKRFGRWQKRNAPPNVAEWITIVITLVIAVIAGVQAYIYKQQKRIMESSGQQTQQLIEAANIQACAAQKIGDASDRNASAADRSAAAAEKFSETARVEAKAQETTAAAVTGQLAGMRKSLRPYIEVRYVMGNAMHFENEGPFSPVAGQPVLITFHFEKLGNSPAYHVVIHTHVAIGEEMAKIAADPVDDDSWSPLTIDRGTGKGKETTELTKTIWHGTEQIFGYGRITYRDNLGILYCTPFEKQYLPNGMWMEFPFVPPDKTMNALCPNGQR